MRWHVYGTDAGTGQDVVLALDEQEATHAVQTAIAKRILVSHVTREAGEGLRRMLVPFACTALLALSALSIAFYVQNRTIRSRLDLAVTEQKRLAQIAAQAESLASQIRQGAAAATPHSPAGDEMARQMSHLVEQLASARTRASQTEQQLSTTVQQMTHLQQFANEVPSLRARLQSEAEALQRSTSEILRLGQENAAQQRRILELASATEPVLKKLAHAEAANKDLASQVDLLKSQLLAAAAATPAAETRPAEPEVAPILPAPPRWAMRTDFAAAAEFLALHFDKDTLRAAPLPDGTVASTGAKPANAATFRLLHDPARDRVYTGTLTLSLAPDAPRDKLAQNHALVLHFLRAFAPSVDKPDALLAAALTQVTPRTGPAERWVFLADDCKLTAWHTGQGEYAFRAESPRADLDP